MRPLETFIEQRKERFVRNSLMSDEFLDFVNKNMKPIEKQMSIPPLWRKTGLWCLQYICTENL